MKIFLSQPLEGMSAEDLLAERIETERHLIREGHEVFCVGRVDASPGDDREALLFFSEILKVLAECDAVLFMSGWEASRICILLWMCADKHSIRIINEENL